MEGNSRLNGTMATQLQFYSDSQQGLGPIMCNGSEARITHVLKLITQTVFLYPTTRQWGLLWCQVRRTYMYRLSVRLSYVRPFVFSFLGNNFSKYQWIFTKLGMCINIMKNWFGVANGQISSFLTVVCIVCFFIIITIIIYSIIIRLLQDKTEMTYLSYFRACIIAFHLYFRTVWYR